MAWLGIAGCVLASRLSVSMPLLTCWRRGSSVPGILLPPKTTVKGALYGRVFDGAKTAPPLTLIFPGKTIGIYRKDGAERGVPWIEPGHVRARFDLIQTPS